MLAVRTETAGARLHFRGFTELLKLLRRSLCARRRALSAMMKCSGATHVWQRMRGRPRQYYDSRRWGGMHVRPPVQPGSGLALGRTTVALRYEGLLAGEEDDEVD